MPTKMMLRSDLSADKDSITLTVFAEDDPLGHLVLAPPDVEQLIQQLGGLRAKMADPVPARIEPLARVTSMIEPSWEAKIQRHVRPVGVGLALRHPGFGWITAILPKRSARLMGEALITLSDRLA